RHDRARSTASSPSTASSTTWPWATSVRRSRFRISVASSATKIRTPAPASTSGSPAGGHHGRLLGVGRPRRAREPDVHRNPPLGILNPYAAAVGFDDALGDGQP